MSRTHLIVNADDGNLTPGVVAGVLRAHDYGIVTSTTIFANFPLDMNLLEAFDIRPGLGVGVHLNITLGSPVAPHSSIRRLLAGKTFARHGEEFFRSIDQTALEIEWRAQIERFSAWRGTRPTHLDTHHHIHRFAPVFSVLLKVATQYKIPIRLCERVDTRVRTLFEEMDVPLADHLIADIGAHPYWNDERLTETLERLPEGTVEIMSHPAEPDMALHEVSSLAAPRAEELKALTRPGLRDRLEELGVILVHYGNVSITD